MTLCNQGCGTHVRFINSKPYNQDGKTPHSETCMSLKFGKWWGGKYNTIPMSKIEGIIDSMSATLNHAAKTRNIDDILNAMAGTILGISALKEEMNEQTERNAKWSEEFDEYKVNLVKEQKGRERAAHFVRADELI